MEDSPVWTLIISVIVIFLLFKGCESCARSLDDTRTDWKAIEHENAVRKAYNSMPLSQEEQQKRTEDSIRWVEKQQRERRTFFLMMQAAGEAEEQWKQEHGYTDGADIQSSYGEGYDDAFLDWQAGRPYNEDGYGTSYNEGYRDGYGW